MKKLSVAAALLASTIMFAQAANAQVVTQLAKSNAFALPEEEVDFCTNPDGCDNGGGEEDYFDVDITMIVPTAPNSPAVLRYAPINMDGYSIHPTITDFELEIWSTPQAVCSASYQHLSSAFGNVDLSQLAMGRPLKAYIFVIEGDSFSSIDCDPVY
ncbi:MAG: hypothetical protein LW823_09670 [Rickettsiales bacterium]|jgi:hypothetical protein|nr:hypothetical protein [Rickettsiales bacterium]